MELKADYIYGFPNIHPMGGQAVLVIGNESSLSIREPKASIDLVLITKKDFVIVRERSRSEIEQLLMAQSQPVGGLLNAPGQIAERYVLVEWDGGNETRFAILAFRGDVASSSATGLLSWAKTSEFVRMNE